MQHRCSRALILDVIDFHGLWTDNRLRLKNLVSEENGVSAADEQRIIPNDVPADE